LSTPEAAGLERTGLEGSDPEEVRLEDVGLEEVGLGRASLHSAISTKNTPNPIVTKPTSAQTTETHRKIPPMMKSVPGIRINKLGYLQFYRRIMTAKTQRTSAKMIAAIGALAAFLFLGDARVLRKIPAEAPWPQRRYPSGPMSDARKTATSIVAAVAWSSAQRIDLQRELIFCGQSESSKAHCPSSTHLCYRAPL
jgi:hypothetical protein